MKSERLNGSCINQFSYPRLYGRSNCLDQVECEAIAISRVSVKNSESGIESAYTNAIHKEDAVFQGFSLRSISASSSTQTRPDFAM